jgi:hypothetical protein
MQRYREGYRSSRRSYLRKAKSFRQSGDIQMLKISQGAMASLRSIYSNTINT